MRRNTWGAALKNSARRHPRIRVFNPPRAKLVNFFTHSMSLELPPQTPVPHTARARPFVRPFGLQSSVFSPRSLVLGPAVLGLVVLWSVVRSPRCDACLLLIVTLVVTLDSAASHCRYGGCDSCDTCDTCLRTGVPIPPASSSSSFVLLLVLAFRNPRSAIRHPWGACSISTAGVRPGAWAKSFCWHVLSLQLLCGR